jgi:hypothetical protein
VTVLGTDTVELVATASLDRIGRDRPCRRLNPILVTALAERGTSLAGVDPKSIIAGLVATPTQ